MARRKLVKGGCGSKVRAELASQTQFSDSHKRGLSPDRRESHETDVLQFEEEVSGRVPEQVHECSGDKKPGCRTGLYYNGLLS